jgi:hypothetical protein
MVSFMPRPLCPGERAPRYSLDRRQGGPKSRSGQREENNFYRTGTLTPTLRSSTRSGAINFNNVTTIYINENIDTLTLIIGLSENFVS